MNVDDDRDVSEVMQAVEKVMDECRMPQDMRGAFLSHYLLALIVVRLDRLLDRVDIL